MDNNDTKGKTVLVVTALSEERKAVLSFLSDVRPGKDKYGLSYIYGHFKAADSEGVWKIILPAPTRAGNVKSAAKTALSLSVQPDMIFLLGVAGGFPGKVNMFDVVVAERIYYVEPAKIDVENSYIPRPDQHKTTEKLLSHAQTLQDIGGWQKILLPELPNEEINVWIEPIAAGEKLVASSSSEEFKRIKRAAPRTVAVENEGFGVLEAAHAAEINAMVVRGISDLLDNRPVDNDQDGNETDDNRVLPDPDKLKAARHASAFMFSILSILSNSDAEELKKAEDNYVLVKMKWEDLKDLAQGRQMVLELSQGAPVYNMTARTGSVEIEFKTLKIFAALVYATWIEKNIFKDLIGVVPDIVDTMIDTSDPDIFEIFVGVRLMNSNNSDEQSEGQERLAKLALRHPAIEKLSNKIASIARNRIKDNSSSVQSPLIDDSHNPRERRRRVSIDLSEEVSKRLDQLISANEAHSYSSLIRSIIENKLPLVGRSISKQEIMNYSRIDHSHKTYNTAIDRDIYNKVSLVSDNYEINRADLLRALVSMDVKKPFRTPRFYMENIKQLQDYEKIPTADLARIAEVSRESLRRALRGESISQSTGMRILRAFEKILGRSLELGEYLKKREG